MAGVAIRPHRSGKMILQFRYVLQEQRLFIIKGNYLKALLFYSVQQLINAAVVRRSESRADITVQDYEEKTVLTVAKDMGDG